MKIILSYWLTFFVIFFGIVFFGYSQGLSADVLIVILMVFYYVAQFYGAYRGFKRGHSWFIAGVIVQALFAVVSPLYFSNFGDPIYEYLTGTWFDSSDAFYPCQLCWWARIMMFPILPLIVIYAQTKARPILWYVYLVTIPGMLLELFHTVLQKPLIGRLTLENPFGCTDANPCAALDVNYFGVFTIPLLCFMAFLLIHILVAFLLFSKKVVSRKKGI